MFDKALIIIKNEPELLATLFFAPIFTGIIIILSPLIKIRIGHIHNDRIGHFAMNTELCYLEKKFLRKHSLFKSIDLMYLPRSPSCNITLEKLWRKKIIILPKFFLRPVSLFIRSFNFLKTFHASSLNSDRDIFNLIDYYPTTLKFNTEDKEKGILYLKKLGLEENSKYICIMCRDQAYLKSIYGQSNKNINEHNYRNNDIDNFLLVAEELTKMGYYVFRMGSIAEKKLKTKNKKIIDYPFSEYKSDFLDIYISANCEFCITTGLGLDAVPNIFRKPIVYVNFVPLSDIHTSSKNFLILPKYCYSQDLGRRMTLKEIIKSKTFDSLRATYYQENKIDLIENTSDEILKISIEMHKKIENQNNDKMNENLQEDFWEIFMKHTLARKKHHSIPKSRIGNDFLGDNEWWLK